jgi:hypothetical protein
VAAAARGGGGVSSPPQRGVDAEAEERVGAEGGEAHEL